MKTEDHNSTSTPVCEWVVTRRHFLTTSGLFAGGLLASMANLRADETVGDAGRNGSAVRMSFGIVTDSHYADKPGRNRAHRESLTKMTECVKLMNEKKVDFLIELGDFIDPGDDEAATYKHIDAIEAIFKTFNGSRYHVLGNHDVNKITKPRFMNRIRNTGIDKDATYYSFDAKGIHFVVLDACFGADGTPYGTAEKSWKDTIIPPKEIEWLENDLKVTDKPTIVFCHQLLSRVGAPFVKNSDKVRMIFKKHKNVLGVFTGHHHPGGYAQVEGIHYYTLKAMVEGSGEENSSYAVVDLHTDNSMTVTGYRKAVSKTLKSAQVQASR